MITSKEESKHGMKDLSKFMERDSIVDLEFTLAPHTTQILRFIQIPTHPTQRGARASG